MKLIRLKMIFYYNMNLSDTFLIAQYRYITKSNVQRCYLSVLKCEKYVQFQGAINIVKRKRKGYKVYDYRDDL